MKKKRKFFEKKNIACKSFLFIASICLCVLTFVACGKETPSILEQAEHLPGESEASILTATPTVLPKKDGQEQGKNPADEHGMGDEDVKFPGNATTPTPTPNIPVPDFFASYLAMPEGTKVDIEGISEDELQFCFCTLNVNDSDQAGFAGQEGLDFQSACLIERLRFMTYQTDGFPYIYEIVADQNQMSRILDYLYQAFLDKTVTELPQKLPEEFLSFGYTMKELKGEYINYRYLVKE